MILGVPYNASTSEVKEAFIRLTKTLHPDVNTSVNANEEFQRVKSAYDVLMNSKHSDTRHSPSRDEGFYQQPSSEEWRQWQSRQRRTKEFDDWMKNVARERRQGKVRRVVKEDNFDFNEGWMGWGWERPAEKRGKSQSTGKREVRDDHFDSFSQGCIFCWKVVTKGHHLKFWCGRYKEGIVEGISLHEVLIRKV